MAIVTLDEKQFKVLLKEALVEFFEERQDTFSAILAEALEDIGLTNAMREAEGSRTVNKQQISEFFRSSPLAKVDLDLERDKSLPRDGLQ
jgi:hypothetical protein